VMTSWRALIGIPNGGGCSLNAKGFSIEQCSWLPNKDFLRILRQGARVARVKFPNALKTVKIRMKKLKKSSQNKYKR
jgi:hypothetical protein